jgi:hypothetical protein|tara:strand:+ start:4149 stop:4373 length:225 start_codon:yes stop_codon:yes gene_type:complete
MSTAYKTLKQRALIGMYKKLLKQGKIQQSGSAYRRMRQLELKYQQQTRWLGVRYQESMTDDHALAKLIKTEDLN